MKTQTKLYTKEDLDFITEQLKSGNKRFKVGQYSTYFSGSGKYLIQRINNFMLGLTFDTETSELILNYPHLSNITEAQLTELAAFLRNNIVIKQTKTNGTNLGFIKTKNNIIHRFRGSIQAESFINEINKKIALGDKTYTGISPEVFTSFLQKYTPIFREGQEKGYLNKFGSIQVKKIISELLPKIKEVFSHHPNVVGIFGEFTSKYNPIAVDGELKYGLYLSSEKEYTFHTFDVLWKDGKGDIYLDFLFCEHLTTHGLTTTDLYAIGDINTCLEEYINEEGVVIKGWDNNPYLKLKHSDVIKWARTMGRLSNVIFSSIEHLFSQGLSFTAKEILEEDILFNPETFDSIVEQVYEEIKTNNITREDLVKHFEIKGRTEQDVDRTIFKVIQSNLMIIVSSALKAKGIPKEKLYREIPGYLYFKNMSTLYYNQKRKKFVANKTYAKMLGRVIGKVYLQNKGENDEV